MDDGNENHHSMKVMKRRLIYTCELQGPIKAATISPGTEKRQHKRTIPFVRSTKHHLEVYFQERIWESFTAKYRDRMCNRFDSNLPAQLKKADRAVANFTIGQFVGDCMTDITSKLPSGAYKRSNGMVEHIC